MIFIIHWLLVNVNKFHVFKKLFIVYNINEHIYQSKDSIKNRVIFVNNLKLYYN